jgi:hypothetical protein
MPARHPRRWRLAALEIAALLGLVAAACDDSSGPNPPASPGLTECGAANRFWSSDFTHSSRIDNRWMPLAPGLQFILDGVANRGGDSLQHRVVFTVTDLTKVVDGVRTVVLWDRDYNNGILQEAELAFFAQDDEGNVWTVGEYPEEFENGEFIGAPSTWIGGVDGADPGILVPASSHIGFTFLQGWAPDIDFLDCGKVYSLGESVCVPYNCYEGVLVVDEWSPLEPGSGHQRKYYAPGVGNVQVGAVDDPEGETLRLANLLQLSPQQLAEARAAALKLEARAYQVSSAYRHTAPAE